MQLVRKIKDFKKRPELKVERRQEKTKRLKANGKRKKAKKAHSS